jgi:4-amino-4-deoxy-L-arabinose transferase-like glycosyltransferase
MRRLQPKTALLALILICSFVLKLHHLGHQALKPLDESFHAIVAENFLKHPLTPTLNDLQLVPRDYRNWQNTQIWLHKPPLATWQIAISYALFGINTLALRLPSAILSTVAVWLTYLIGIELLDATAALIAATLQAFNPVILSLVHGYLFSDHVDISLLFWTELSIYFLARSLRTQRQRDLILCGVAQGLAFLSKTYPALIVSGLAIVACILPQLRLNARGMLIIILATLATILPWNLFAAIRWPQQFFYENIYVLRHLSQSIEDWGGPWDRLMFDFLIRVNRTFYPAILAATIVLIIHARRRRNEKLWLIIFWAIGVLIPHLLATTKTLSATLIGWPALWLLLGYLISMAIRGDATALGAWLIAMILALLIGVADIPTEGRGYPPTPGFAIIMQQHIWVLWQMLASLLGGAAFILILKNRRAAVFRTVSFCIATLITLFLCVGYIHAAWQVTQIDKETPNFQAIGQFAKTLPPNAAFMVDEQVNVENKLIQFVADRSCYWVKNLHWEPMGQEIVNNGGLPYLITQKPMDLPIVLVDKEDNRTVYACSPRALAAAQHGGAVLQP